jgi:hypothetical protein
MNPYSNFAGVCGGVARGGGGVGGVRGGDIIRNVPLV